MTDALVVFDKVTKRFGESTAVRGFDLEIIEGEFLAIMGPSGCGKTTTLRMLAGLERPSEGEIRLNGRRMNEVKASARDTPMVWQNLALFPFLNVVKNVEFGLKMRGLDAAARRARAMEWLDRLGIGDFAERDVAQLSGGQRQRVALARALVTEPGILLLDEPLSALDANLVIRMQGVLSRLQKDLGITFVYVTHSQSEAFAMADRVVVMNDGRIAQTGSPREVYRNPANRFVAEFVGTNNILVGRVSGLTEERIGVETDLGRFQAARSGRVSLEDGQPATCVVSADLVQLSGIETALENRIACSLISEEFVGSMVTLFLETAGGIEFKVQTSQRILERLDLSGATPLFASWSPEHAHILPGDPSARRNRLETAPEPERG